MRDRPYTLLSCALSIDGYLGTASPPRLELSNDADFDRVDAVRASCDAILVGAGTVRHDNPRLLVRSEARREARRARGVPASPIKVTVTGRGGLDPDADFFSAGDAEKLVYCTSERALDARSRLDAGPRALALTPGQATAIADRHTGVGCDQLITIEPSPGSTSLSPSSHRPARTPSCVSPIPTVRRRVPAATPRAAWPTS